MAVGSMTTGMKTVKANPWRVAALSLLLILSLTSLLFFAIAPAAKATVLEPLTLEQLAQRATTVVIARADASEARMTRVGQGANTISMLQTYVDLQVVDIVKGSAPVDIVVPVLGGELGSYRVEVDGMPVFTPGETSLLFLDAQGRVIGGVQGKLDITGGIVRGMSQSLASVQARIGRALSATGTGTATVDESLLAASESATANVVGAAALAVPTITNISPGAAPAGIGDTVTITGTGFGPAGGSVNFFYRSGQPTISAPIVSWSDTSIVAEVPVGLVGGYSASASSGPVTVTNSSAQTSVGYNFQVTFGYGSLRWLQSVVNFRVNPNTSDTTQERALIDAAAAVWSAPADFGFTDVGTCSTTTPITNDGKNDMFWNSTLLPSGVIATAWTCYWDELILEVDICFNDTFNWGDGTGGTMDVESIALHEMGHWLKLRDLYGTADSSKVMYGLRSYGTQSRVLSPGDLAGIMWIYGPSGPSAPVVAAGSDKDISVGSTLTGAGSFSDPDDESWAGTVDYGDGSGTVPLALNSNKTFSLSHLYDEVGTYTVTVSITDSGALSGSDTLTVAVDPPSPDYARYIGTDRFDTALLLSRAAFPGALPAGSGLVLAPGETFPEALCGAPLAAAYGGPVLLTPTVGLNNAVRAEIIRLAPETVILVGLSDAIRDAVQTALGSEATVIAIRGTLGSVYDMSYKVALALEDRVGDMSAALAIITRGDMFPDAIGVSPLACAKKWPILLTNSVGGALHPRSVAALSELNITTALKVGTYTTLPAGVTGISNLSGADRYSTNVKVAQWAEANAGLSFSHTGVATGDKFPDALASGPYLAKDNGILLLSPLYGPLPPSVGGEIDLCRLDVQKVTFVAMIEPVIGQVKALLP